MSANYSDVLAGVNQNGDAMNGQYGTLAPGAVMNQTTQGTAPKTSGNPYADILNYVQPMIGASGTAPVAPAGTLTTQSTDITNPNPLNTPEIQNPAVTPPDATPPATTPPTTPPNGDNPTTGYAPGGLIPLKTPPPPRTRPSTAPQIPPPPSWYHGTSWEQAYTWGQTPGYGYLQSNPGIVDTYAAWVQANGDAAKNVDVVDWLKANGYDSPDAGRRGFDTFSVDAQGNQTPWTQTQPTQAQQLTPPKNPTSPSPVPVNAQGYPLNAADYPRWAQWVQQQQNQKPLPITPDTPVVPKNPGGAPIGLPPNLPPPPQPGTPTPPPGAPPLPGSNGNPATPDAGQQPTPPPTPPVHPDNLPLPVTPSPNQGGPLTEPPPSSGRPPAGASIGDQLRQLLQPEFDFESQQLGKSLNAEGALTGAINSGGFGTSFGQAQAQLAANQGQRMSDYLNTDTQNALQRALQLYQINTGAGTAQQQIQSQMAIAALQNDTQRFGIQTNADLQKYLNGQDNSIKRYGIDSNTVLEEYKSQLQLAGEKYSADNQLDIAKLNAAIQQTIGQANAHAQEMLANARQNETANQYNEFLANLANQQYDFTHPSFDNILNAYIASGATPAQIAAILQGLQPPPVLTNNP